MVQRSYHNQQTITQQVLRSIQARTTPEPIDPGPDATVGSSVQDSIAKVLRMSVQQSETNNQPSRPYIDSPRPLGSYVPKRLKEKIFNNEFIEFERLLDTKYQDEYALKFTPSGNGATVCFGPSQKSKPITDVHQWTSAFNIFASIYLEKFPNDARRLFKYCETVRELAKLHPGLAWKLYDFDFQNLKQEIPTLAWNMVHKEIWNRALLEPRTESHPLA